MAPPSIVVVGLKELRAEVQKAADKGLKQELIAANKELAEEIVRRALPRVPIKTGRLRTSVRASGTIAGAIGRVGGVRVPYAPPIHWGWPNRNIRARPFLKDAADTIERDVTDRYADRVQRVLDRVSVR